MIKLQEQINLNENCGLGAFSNAELEVQREKNREKYGPVIDAQAKQIQQARDEQNIVNEEDGSCKLQSLICKQPEKRKSINNANFKPLKDEFTRCSLNYTGLAVSQTEPIETDILRGDFGAGKEGC